MTSLPLSSDFTGPITEGDFKAAVTAQRNYLSGLFGSDGETATALATLGAFASDYLAKTAAYTVALTDKGKLIDATTGTWTLALPTAATAGQGFTVIVRNSGTGTITIDPAGAELVDGATTNIVTSGSSIILTCTGVAWAGNWMTSPSSSFAASKANLASPAFTGTPSSAGVFLFADGTSSAPGLAFSGDTNTGFNRAASDTIAASVGGAEALRITSARNLYIGSANPITGMGPARLTMQGASAAESTFGHMRASANELGPLWEMVKTRGAAVDDYTAVQVADRLGNLRFRGADGTTTILGASISSVVESVSAGDVRASLRFNTGSGANAITERFKIDAVALTATLPFYAASGSAAAPSYAFASSPTTGPFRPSADQIGWAFAGAELYRMTGSVFRMGSPTANINSFGGARIEVSGQTAASATIGQFAAVSSAVGPSHIFGKSRGAAITDYTIVNAGDTLGSLMWRGADGAALVASAATIAAVVAGTPASGDVRAELRFSTGSGAAAVTEVLRLGIDANVYLPTSGQKLFIGGTAAGNQVLTGRITGWGAWTGTPTRTTFATSTATLTNVAETLKALIDDLRTHGLIGT